MASKTKDKAEEAAPDEQTEEAKNAAEDRLEQAGEQGEDAQDAAGGAVAAATDALKDGVSAGGAGLLKAVVNAARDAAKEVLEKEAASGAKQAAEMLASKAPELAKEQLEKHGGTGPAAKAAMEFGKAKLEGSGGPGAAMTAAKSAFEGVVDKVKPGGGDDDDDEEKGSGDPRERDDMKTRRLPIEYDIDVAVPLEVAYNQWTQFEDSPRWMKRIESISQTDDTHLQVSAKVWGFKRQWNLEIVDQVPNERIAWQTESGSRHKGVVSFHKIDDHLTRVMLLLDFPPDGLNEKLASGLRLVKRAARGDMQRFRSFVELRDEETGAWRGEIEEGEVVSESDEEREEQQDDDAQSQNGSAEYEDEEVEDEDVEEDVDEPEAEEDVDDAEEDVEDEEVEEEDEPVAEE